MELMKVIAMRKSTRSFKSEQISDESLDTIIKAGCAAPIGQGNYSAVHITIIQNSKLLDRIAKTTSAIYKRENFNPLYGAPTLILISGQPNEKFPTGATANAACIIENMALAATDIGIGSLYLMGILSAFTADSKLLEALNLPDGFIPASGIALGYPTEPLSSVKELKQTIKMNTIQ